MRPSTILGSSADRQAEREQARQTREAEKAAERAKEDAENLACRYLVEALARLVENLPGGAQRSEGGVTAYDSGARTLRVYGGTVEDYAAATAAIDALVEGLRGEGA